MNSSGTSSFTGANDGVLDHLGHIRLTTGAAANNGLSLLSAGVHVRNVERFMCIFRFPTIITGLRARFGIMLTDDAQSLNASGFVTPNPSDTAIGAYFLYDADQSPVWQCVCRDSTGITKQTYPTNTAVVLPDKWILLTLRRESTAVGSPWVFIVSDRPMVRLE